MKNKKLILATTLPHRIKAFKMLGIPFKAEGSDVEEYYDGRPVDPEALVLCLAKLKAEAVSKKHSENCVIIGFDSVACFDERILEKPKTKAEAFKRLKTLSGNVYQFYTGIYLIDNFLVGGKTTLPFVSRTEVLMRKLRTTEINRYLEKDKNFKTYAQGYDALGTYGSTFVKEIRGSYNNLLRGMPLEIVVMMLQEVGFVI